MSWWPRGGRVQETTHLGLSIQEPFDPPAQVQVRATGLIEVSGPGLGDSSSIAPKKTHRYWVLRGPLSVSIASAPSQALPSPSLPPSSQTHTVLCMTVRNRRSRRSRGDRVFWNRIEMPFDRGVCLARSGLSFFCPPPSSSPLLPYIILPSHLLQFSVAPAALPCVPWGLPFRSDPSSPSLNSL